MLIPSMKNENHYANLSQLSKLHLLYVGLTPNLDFHSVGYLFRPPFIGEKCKLRVLKLKDFASKLYKGRYQIRLSDRSSLQNISRSLGKTPYLTRLQYM